MSNRLAPFTPNTSRAFRLEVICVGNGWVRDEIWGGWKEVEIACEECDFDDFDDSEAWWERRQHQKDYDRYTKWLSSLSCPKHGNSHITFDGTCSLCGWSEADDEEEAAELLPATMGTEYVYSDDEIPF